VLATQAQAGQVPSHERDGLLCGPMRGTARAKISRLLGTLAARDNL
jgi:hypothetical protein